MLNHTSSLYNLTAIRKPDDIVQKHIIDALTLLPFLDKEDPKSIIDIGSGAGFPGLVLAIARPHWYITLLESVRKKTLFHLDVMERLPLTNVTSEWDRAESFARENGIRESFCIAVARSVAEMRVLAEFSLPLVKVGGCLVAQKSLDSERLEISAAERSIRTCGGSSAQVIPPSLKPFKSYNEEEDERGRKKCLVVVRKVGPTPLTYPRRPGVPKQTPL